MEESALVELTVNRESEAIVISMNLRFFPYGQLHHMSHHATDDTHPKPVSLPFFIIPYYNTKFI